MSELSPAAQAVLDAYRDADIDDEATAAAVLRAAADQVVPYEPLKGCDQEAWERDEIRVRLLAIAHELEAQ